MATRPSVNYPSAGITLKTHQLILQLCFTRTICVCSLSDTHQLISETLSIINVPYDLTTRTATHVSADKATHRYGLADYTARRIRISLLRNTTDTRQLITQHDRYASADCATTTDTHQLITQHDRYISWLRNTTDTHRLITQPDRYASAQYAPTTYIHYTHHKTIEHPNVKLTFKIISKGRLT